MRPRTKVKIKVRGPGILYCDSKELVNSLEGKAQLKVLQARYRRRRLRPS